ncbi:hypothetical protein Celaphus_00013583 [Cervus elaphus hippelaphus]|uniref:Uncharacterized protein n=1 Tax=Cervus elaphus hippelaphus TaxID=46360 RepID=A0A212DH20_CEREH|nr:hypothetical protein Celaphus_00013583 [Cervus elaphus hippelaphus]
MAIGAFRTRKRQNPPSSIELCSAEGGKAGRQGSRFAVASPSIPAALSPQSSAAGNKIDLAERREVSQQRAEEFSEAQDMYYLETSAKESDNVEKLFLDLACRLISEARQNTLVDGTHKRSLIDCNSTV